MNDVKITQVRILKIFKPLLDSSVFAVTADVMKSYHLLEFCCVGARGG